MQGAAYAGATSLENSFVQCDFTGPFTEAISIDGTAGTNVATSFDHCVFSAPIGIPTAYWTTFTGCHFW